MQIEVTDKEATEIYEQRYIDKHRKSARVLFGIFAALFLVSWMLLTYYLGTLQGLIAMVFVVPIFYSGVKRTKAARKYANSQFEAQK